MEVVHRAVRCAVMTFVVVGMAVSLAGPDSAKSVAAAKPATHQTPTENTAATEPQLELLATEGGRATLGSGI